MVAYVLFTTFGGICSYFSLVKPLPLKLPVKIRVLLFFYIVTCMVFLEASLGQFVTYISLTGALLFLFHFTSGNWLCLSCAMFGYIFSVTMNQIYLWIVQFLTNESIEQLLQSQRTALTISLIYCIICYALTSLLGWYLKYKIKIQEKLTDNHLMFGVFLFLVLLTCLFIFNISYGDRLGFSYGVIAFNGILFQVLFATAVWIMHFIYKAVQKQERTISIATQFDNLQQYTGCLEESYTALRSFKHDYLNILTTMSGYLKERDYDNLEYYFNEKILPLGQQIRDSDSRIGLLAAIRIPEVKSLVSSKFTYAMGRGITVSIDIADPIEDIPMEIIDLTRILGIFLDNAIEASLDCEEKKLDFSMFYMENQLNIVIRNTSLPPAFPVSSLCEYGLSSKGDGRGLGLYQVSQILTHYPEVILDTEYQEPFFTQRIIFSVSTVR